MRSVGYLRIPLSRARPIGRGSLGSKRAQEEEKMKRTKGRTEKSSRENAMAAGKAGTRRRIVGWRKGTRISDRSGGRIRKKTRQKRQRMARAAPGSRP